MSTGSKNRLDKEAANSYYREWEGVIFQHTYSKDCMSGTDYRKLLFFSVPLKKHLSLTQSEICLCARQLDCSGEHILWLEVIPSDH